MSPRPMEAVRPVWLVVAVSRTIGWQVMRPPRPALTLIGAATATKDAAATERIRSLETDEVA